MGGGLYRPPPLGRDDRPVCVNSAVSLAPFGPAIWVGPAGEAAVAGRISLRFRWSSAPTAAAAAHELTSRASFTLGNV